MKTFIAGFLCILMITTPALAQTGNQFEVRYAGGSVASTVKADDWKNSLTVTSEIITLKLKDGQELKIEPKNVRLITHGHQASRKIGTYAALAIISPIFLLGMLKKNKKNFVGLAYENSDGTKGGINLQVKNDKYLAALTALEGVTGLKTEEELSEKEQKEKEKREQKEAEKAKP
jgi:hypothetical protein